MIHRKACEHDYKLGRLSPLCFRLILVFVSTGLLFASTDGSLSGLVRDPSGLAAIGAKVTITNTGSGAVRAVLSGAAGSYAFPALAAGRYVLEASAPGFAKYRVDGIVLDANQVLRIDVALRLGSPRQSVEVRANPVEVDLANTQTGEVIGSHAMEELPLNGRSYTALMALQPGVLPVSAGTLPGSITLGGSVLSGNVSISGSRESANAFEVDGGEIEEPRLNGTAMVPNLDSLAEFRIVTTGADAEYGHYSGAVVNVVTKGGGNELHGNAFDFLRNQVLDARNFFDTQRGRFQRNQFGGTLGGPVRRNRVFFFVDYQGTRETRGLASGDVVVPTPAERGGDFSQIAASALTGTVGGANFASYLSSRLGYSVTAGERYYVPGCTSRAACVFPNGIIPQAAFSVPAKALLQAIPVPNSGSVFTTSADNNVMRDDLGGFRLDVDSGVNTFLLYGSIDSSSLWKQFGTNNVPGFPTTDRVRPSHLDGAYTRTFGAEAVNELHLGVTRYVVSTDVPDAGTEPGTLAELGFGSKSEGGLIAAVPSLEGVPPITFNDLSIGTPQFSYNAYETTAQFRDNLSLVRGLHSMKFGADGESTRFVDRFPLLFGNGAFAFTGAETGNDFADFLIGAPTTFTQQSNIDLDERKNYFGVYGEDSWKVSPHLTVNAGLRWEYLPAFGEHSGEKATFVQGVQSSVFPTAPTGLLYPGDSVPGFGKIPDNISRTPLNDFAPRIGAAYSPSFASNMARKLFGGAGMTSVRASYGIYYSTIEGIGAYFGDPPVPFTTLYVAASPPYFAEPYVDRATGTLHANPFPGETVRPGSNVDWSTFEPIAGLPAASIHNVVPYSEKYSFSVERAFADRAVLRLGYTGAEGHHLLATAPNNPGNPQKCIALSHPSGLTAGSPVCGPFGEDTTYTTAAGQTIYGTRTPFGGPSFGDNSDVATIANSSYNALEASLRWVSRDLQVLAGYTYSKSLDDSSAFDDNPLNPFNHRLSRSLSAFDLTHNVVVSYLYDFPFHGRGAWMKLVGGWKVAGIARFATGLPVTLYENDDRSLLGLFGSGVGIFVPIDEPDFAGGVIRYSDPRSGKPYFNTSGFSAEPLGQLGTANRRFLHGPGIDNLDLALLKDTAFGEQCKLEFRAEFFNGFNHAQFLNPSGNFSDPTNFGMVRAARDPRIGQLAVKLMF